MAKLKIPGRVPWLPHVKKSRQLEVFLDDSLGSAGWTAVFRNALTEFNKLSTNLKLGVSVVESKVRKSAQVEAHAAKGNIDFSASDYGIPKQILAFDGFSVHGLCKPLIGVSDNKNKVERFTLLRCFIYVPATPTGDRNGVRSPVGDPVKLVIAVHELIHVCGLVDDTEHSTDDIFCWPGLRMGSKPSEDRLTALGDRYTFPGLPGEKRRVGHRKLDLPPIVLKNQTADKIRKLWA